MQLRTRGIRRLPAALAGLAAALAAAPALAAGPSTITVRDDFVEALSGTRATGHYEVVGTGLRLWTEGSTSTDEVTEHVARSTALAATGEPSLDFTDTTGGGVPAAQLVVDFDADGEADGTLVGEEVRGDVWWLDDGAEPFVKDGAPVTGGGSGSAWHGTLEQWRDAFPIANLTAFGFSLRPGGQVDGVLHAIDFAGTRYTFAEPR